MACFGFQANLAILNFDGVLHLRRSVFLAKLFSLFLHKLLERLEGSGGPFRIVLLSRHCHRIVKSFHLVCFGVHIGTHNPEWLRFADVDHLRRFVLKLTNTLNRQQCILRTAIAFLFDPELLLPE